METVDPKELFALCLAHIWYKIVWSASDRVLTEVIPWLQGAIMPPPGGWW